MIDPARLSAFIASRICHDLVSPVSGVTSALEMLDEPGDSEMDQQFEELLRSSALKAAATIQFLRYAYGSLGLQAGKADMHDFKKITENFLAGLKPSIEWDIATDHLSYSHARLLMNLIMMAIDTLPRGGVINARVRNEAAGMTMTVSSRGERVKLKDEAARSVQGIEPEDGWKPDNIQPLFAKMICDSLEGEITAKQGEDVAIIMATQIRAEG